MNYGLTTLRNDLFGGVTTTAVLLPAALAYGVLSGIGPAAGLYGAVAAGFFAGLFGGTRAQITGPSAALAVVTAVIVANYAASLTEALMI
ncbi:MAG: SulP family inorganic anion transporter, partial [Rhodospirillaceae bacterium]|nr:SulP family inorganic anion transporter [Rhodospirillaceae bacterium]